MRKEEELKEVRGLIAEDKADMERRVNELDPKKEKERQLIAYLDKRWLEANARLSILNWVLEEDSSARLDDDINALRSQHRHE